MTFRGTFRVNLTRVETVKGLFVLIQLESVYIILIYISVYYIRILFENAKS